MEVERATDGSAGVAGLVARPARWPAVVGAGTVGLVAVIAVVIALRPASPYPYLTPWIVLTAAVLVLIVITAPADRRGDVLDPVVFAIVTYFAPFAVVGALLLAGGWATPFYLELIADPRRNLPLAQVYLLLGVAALAIGSRLAIASRAGRWIHRHSPSIGLTTHNTAFGLIALHVLGLGALYWGFQRGLIGYQVADAGRSGALPAYLATVLIPARVGVAMLWTLDSRPRRPQVRAAAAVSAGAVAVEMVIGASRATLVTALLAALFGAIAAGWRPRFGRVAVWLVAGSVVLASSAVFATNFRSLKNPAGTERTVTTTDQLGFAVEAAGQTVARGPLVITDAFDLAADRLETTGQVAVVVSRYRSVGDEERAAGIDNSVIDAIAAGAIPRVLWPGKPDPPDPRTLSAIYFEFDDNSFATTPMTDLLRNFGPFGVALGMALLGVALGAVGVFRRSRHASIATNMVVAAVLIRGVSYEGFYGGIVSDSARVAVVAIAGALLVRSLARLGPPETDAVDTPDERGDRPRRAAVVSVDLSQRGGHQGVAAYLQDCLEREGWTVSVISLATSARDRNSMRLLAPRTWRGPIATDEEFDGRPYRHVGCWLAEAPFLRARPRRVLDRELDDQDVIVMGVGSAFWALAVPPDRRDRTVVEFVTRYDDEVVSALDLATGWRRLYWHIQRRVVGEQEQRALQRVAAFIVPSDELASWAISNGADDTTVIPHAIVDRFEPDPTAVVGPTIVAVARWVDPRKNLALLLDAYGLAVDVDGSIGSLALIGTRPDLDGDQALAERVTQLGDHVLFLGETTQRRLVEILQSARMLVLASDQEGFGLPLVEAMACGCPVIATRSGGSELTVVDGVNGLLVPRRDAQALATSILRLAGDGGLRRRLSRGALESAEAYRVDALAPEIDGVVRRVAQGASSVSRATSVEA